MQIQTIFVACALAMVVSGCSKEEATINAQTIEVGGLYIAQNDDGSWGVMKVLAVDDRAVHLRSYANKFTSEPRDLDPSTLTLGAVGDPGGFGIGHFPLAKEGFWNDNPKLLKVVPVTEDELEGYKLYLEAMQSG